ncbi:MAG: glycosyltransferase family 4 protein [Spirochaetota bacterium]
MNNLTSQKKKVAYLGPEIPSISATFIYNEIIALEEKDISIFIYSVHYPEVMAEEPDAKKLYDRIKYLYKTPKYKFILYTVIQLFTNYKNFIKTTAKLIHDIISLKIFTSNSIKLIYQFFAGGLLAYELRRNGIQHLHVHFAHVPAQIGMYASGFTGIPFTFTAHANDIFQTGLLLREKAERAKNVITISEYNKRFLVSKGISPEKISIVRCGIKTGVSIIVKPQNKIPVIGSLGRLVEKKGMDVLLTACMLLKKEGFKFKLEIAGDGPLLESLKNQCEVLNINDRTNFIGPLRHDMVFEWLKILSVFALACKQDKNGDTDGIPVVLMEAMAYNVPVISTSITGIPELIEHKKTGLLSPPDNAELLHHNLKKILTDKDIRKRLITNARKRIEGEFSEDVNIERIYKIITHE